MWLRRKRRVGWVLTIRNDTNMTCFVRMHKHPSKTFSFTFIFLCLCCSHGHGNTSCKKDEVKKLIDFPSSYSSSLFLFVKVYFRGCFYDSLKHHSMLLCYCRQLKYDARISWKFQLLYTNYRPKIELFFWAF